ncbi:MAG: branched-chain amino acid transporter substrate-binding protein [Nocardioidaceae bacterium]|nr:branched-chain amino acid transporter substrate-binding protein [Nocardioidaceae bacterium]
MASTPEAPAIWQRPGLARPAVWVVITALVAALPTFGLGPSDVRQIVLILMLSLVVSGLNLSFGYTGELSFAQPAMYAIGAYATTVIALHVVNDVLVALVVSCVAGFLLGMVSGIPGLRLGGWVLAIASLYLVLLVPDVVSLFDRWTGGFQGIGGIPLPQILGRELDANGFFVLVVVVSSAWFALFRNLVVSPWGNSLSVVRHSPVLASSLGISVYATKLKAYAISGLPAAIGGTFFAYLDGFVAPNIFDTQLAIVILSASILGGSRSVFGAFAGAALLQLGPLRSTAFGDYAFIAYGAFLILAGVALRGGLVGLFRTIRGRLPSRRPTVPTTAASRTGRRTITLPPMVGKPLTISGISKSFGGNAALSDVSFSVAPGEVVALIGPNGSGKTTLLNIISGYYRADAGAITVGEDDVTGRGTHRIARAGIARTFQTPLVPDLTVREAIATARLRINRVSVLETMLRLPRHHRAVRDNHRVGAEIIEALGLGDVADSPAQSLPLGTRRLLELARSLAGQPAILLLDEVASGLDDEEIEELSRIIRAVRENGGSILLVEHNFPLVQSLADRVVVLSRGTVVTVDDPMTVARHPEVLEHYLGQPRTGDEETDRSPTEELARD